MTDLVTKEEETAMMKFVEEHYGTVPNYEFTLLSFWSKFAVAQNKSSALGYHFVQKFKQLFKRFHLLIIDLRMKMKLMQDLKFKMTDEARKELLLFFGVQVEVDDNNCITCWKTTSQMQNLEIIETSEEEEEMPAKTSNNRKSKIVESSDDDEEENTPQSSKIQNPSQRRKIVPWRPRSRMEQRAEAQRENTPPPSRIRHPLIPIEESSSSSEEEEEEEREKRRKGIATRTRFDQTIQISMANYLLKKMRENKKGKLLGPKSIKFWDRYIEEENSLKTAQSLCSHYRKIFPKCLFKLPLRRENILELYKNYQLPTKNIEIDLQRRFKAEIRFRNGFVDSWRFSSNGTPPEKRGRVYSPSSSEASQKSPNSSENGAENDEEREKRGNNESGFESSPSKSPAEQVENVEQDSIMEIEESVGERENENIHMADGVKEKEEKELDETMSLSQDMENGMNEVVDGENSDNKPFLKELRTLLLDGRGEEIERSMENHEKSVHEEQNSTNGELNVAMCEVEETTSNVENLSKAQILRLRGKAILVDHVDQPIPLLIQENFKKEIEEVLKMAEEFSKGEEIMSSALTDTTNKMNAEVVGEVVAEKVAEKEIEKVAETTEQVAETVEQVAETTEQVAETVEQVAETTEQVAETTEQVAEATEEVAEATEQVAEATEEVATTTETVEDVAMEATEQAEAATEEVAETSEQVAEATEEVATASETVEEEAATEEVAADENEQNVELTKEQKTEEMRKHLTAGRRLLLTNEFNKATDILSLASQFAGEVFGDDSEHSFEPFFYYAQALLELAKVEDQVFSNALSNIPIQEEDEEKANDSIDEEQYGNPEKLTDEEREEIKQQVEDALETGAAGEADGSKPAEDLAEAEASTGVEAEAEAEAEAETNEVAEQATETKATEEVTEMEVEEGEAEAEEDDDESSMKLAWELFETSRRICDKKLESLAEDAVEDLKKWTLHKADVLGFLGEHGIVDGKAEQAQKDLQAALELQAKHHGETSRVLAQTNHLLAKAFRLDGGFDEAAKHFEKSKKLLLARSDELKSRLEAEVDEARKTIEDELKELAELIPEMDVFIDDSKASAEQAAKIKETVKEELATAAAALKNLTGSGDATEAVKDANDISGMIRRPAKRQASPQTAEDEGDSAKKAKCDEPETAQSAETVTEATA